MGTTSVHLFYAMLQMSDVWEVHRFASIRNIWKKCQGSPEFVIDLCWLLMSQDRWLCKLPVLKHFVGFCRQLPEKFGELLSAEQYKEIEELGLLADLDDQVRILHASHASAAVTLGHVVCHHANADEHIPVFQWQCICRGGVHVACFLFACLL